MDLSSGITLLLRRWRGGERDAFENLILLVYRRLYETARRQMSREQPGHLLQNTALVHETYLQLSKLDRIEWKDRGHFFRICTRIMRRILIDDARSRLSRKAGAGAVHLPLEENIAESQHPSPDFFLTLDSALKKLAKIDERQYQVVQLRFFTGLTIQETAQILSVSERTVKGDWTMAKLWLLRELDGRCNNGRQT